MTNQTFARAARARVIRLSLLGASSLAALTVVATPGLAQEVRLPAGENIERAPAALPPEGFLLSVEGRPRNADAGYADTERRADYWLDRNDVKVTFDGLGARPRLDAFVVRPAAGGETVQFQSRMNYPAFVRKGEIRIYADGGRRLVQTAEIDANGQTSVTLPDSEGLAYSYRVYDAVGRYDETELMPLAQEGRRPIARAALEDGGTDATARRAIPIRGGSVTVQVSNIMGGGTVRALGTEVKAGRDGVAVINRILPVGEHEIEVGAKGRSIIRPINIPASDWFATGVADFKIGRRAGGFEDLGQGRDIRYGRLQGYVNGYTAGGWEITASADTQEDEFENLLRNITKRDPRSILSRLDPDLYYPTYGDDSELRDDTPTSSGLYLKVEREGSHAMLGDFRTSIDSTELLRNERALYGVQGVYRSRAQTSRGEAKAGVELYAAQPEEMPRRDQFRATGGSSYFLSSRDLVVGSETVQIEIRDPDTGRFIERVTLVYGRDYEINYSQGLVMLRRPLSSFVRDAGFIGSAEPDGQYLVVQYDYTPLFEELDGYSYGGRAEAWLGDHLRVGVTGSTDTTGEADQIATGADLRLAFGKDSYVQLEHAQTDGPGFSSTFSSDGGLRLSEGARIGGKGAASRVDAVLALQDLGLGIEGLLRLSYEDREAGFATIDRQTSSDERMGEIDLEAKLSERVALRFNLNRFEQFEGDRKTEATAELDYRLTEATEVTLGLAHLDRLDTDRADRSGERTDLGLRVHHRLSDRLAVYGYGIASLTRSGEIARGDRLGLGADWQITEAWAAQAEISDGDAGQGALARLEYTTKTGSAYVGYELEADRDLDGTKRLSGSDGGTFTFGGRRQLGESVAMVAESTYDIFGDKKSFGSSYGVEYLQSDTLTHDIRYEYGQVRDVNADDITRQALSLGTRFDNREGLAVRGRIELREDETFADTGTTIERSALLNGQVRYDLDEGRRLTANAELLRSGGAAEDDRDYTDIVLGYAMRPVEHDRWTVLAKYQYFYDLYGQTLGSTDIRGPRQRSHVFSLDGSLKVSDHWTLGGKVGGRIAETQSGSGEWSVNDAYLGVLNARYHLPHSWDLLVEGRLLTAPQAKLDQSGVLVAGYKHLGDNFMLGAGYNFSQFSDDLTDLVHDDRGVFINLIAKY